MIIPYHDGIGLVKTIDSLFDLKYKNKKVKINKNIHWLANQEELMCDCCGTKPSHFTLRKEADRFHFELHDINGVKFTIDHTLARCVGGLNEESNFKPLCSKCNCWKSKYDAQLKELVKQDEEQGIILLLEEITDDKRKTN